VARWIRRCLRRDRHQAGWLARGRAQRTVRVQSERADAGKAAWSPARRCALQGLAAAALERVRRKLNDGGDRQILTAVLMMGCRPLRPLAQKRIRCRHRHRDVILNILARQQPQAASAPIATPACLPVKITPLADCAQYDSLSCMPLCKRVRLRSESREFMPAGSRRLCQVRGDL
jgi:hypothetical protein